MLQVISSNEQFFKYIKSIESLSDEEETQLTLRYYNHRESEIAEKIIMANLKNVLYMCFKYKGYNLPIHDMFQEGTIGLMKALDKFEPERGFKFMTFASIWVKSYILDYVVDNISIVRQFITKAERKLFFNYRKLRSIDTSDKYEDVKRISKLLEIDENVVRDFSSSIETIEDFSLNTEASPNPDYHITWQDRLIYEEDTDKKELENDLKLVYSELKNLDERTRDIIIRRHLSEVKTSLETLSIEYGISKERVRQIEAAGFKTIKERLTHDNL